MSASTPTLTGVSPGYAHATKSITPREPLDIRGYATLKWYDIALPDAPVPADVAELARQCLVDEVQGGAIELEGLGFVILHRCGDAFYFLLACTWSGDNELWETVWAKDGDGDATFRPWPLARGHHPTFCVWELGAVWHEQQAWSRLLRTERSGTDIEAYLADSYSGPV
jgi:hypothetical protein